MDDRNFYKTLVKDLSKDLPPSILQAKIPASYITTITGPDNIREEYRRELRAEKFTGNDLVAESVDDPEKMQSIRAQRIIRLNRMLNKGLLETPFNIPKIVGDIMDYESYKSIGTVMNRLSDTHIFSNLLLRRLAERDPAIRPIRYAFESIWKKLFDQKEKRSKRHKMADDAVKQLYEQFADEIAGKNELDQQSSRRYEILLFQTLAGHFPAFTKNYKLKNVDLTRDHVFSPPTLSVVVAIDDGIAKRDVLTLPKKHADLFLCLFRFRERTGSESLFILPELLRSEVM